IVGKFPKNNALKINENFWCLVIHQKNDCCGRLDLRFAVTSLISTMLGFRGLSKPTALVISLPRVCITHQSHLNHVPFRKRPQNLRKLVVCAKEENNGDKEGLKTDPDLSNGNGEENQRPTFFNLRWAELLLDPDPDNVLAVGLTGLLTWASVQVVWQLLAVSLAIVVAALKYSFVAALLIFILVALL
ncbi:hypothetical protein KSS87_023078, partial [Heliosperma pusillum]